ncbi:hypothetical protein AB1N83_005691 [Pleurotus pulmonarius]
MIQPPVTAWLSLDSQACTSRFKRVRGYAKHPHEGHCTYLRVPNRVGAGIVLYGAFGKCKKNSVHAFGDYRAALIVCLLDGQLGSSRKKTTASISGAHVRLCFPERDKACKPFLGILVL